MPCCPVWAHILIFLLLLLPCGTELVIFCVSRELIFAIRIDVSFSGMNFCDFQKVPDPAYIFVFNDYLQ